MTTGTEMGGVTPVAWIAMRAALDDGHADAISAAADPGALVEALVEAEAFAEAVRCVAAALPLREGVWWAWVAARNAARRVHGDRLPEPVDRALTCTEAWIADPTDRNGLAAWEAAGVIGIDKPAGGAAAAAFMAGGSITAPGGPAVPPPPGVSGTLVGAVVTVAALMPDAAAAADVYRHELAQGRAIIDKLGGWEAAIRRTWDALDAQHRAHVAAATPPSGGAAA
jgi:hypothetical protein